MDAEDVPARRVITYGATPSGEINLCTEHDSDEDAQTTRTQVQHGAHQGYCDVCERLAGERAIQSARAECARVIADAAAQS